MFQFVNSFNAIFYIAFIKRHNEGCFGTDPDTGKTILTTQAVCTGELGVQVRTILLIALFKNIMEIGVPFA